MSNKSFMLTVVAVLLLGGMVGGAFVAGLVVGGGSDKEEVPNVLTLPPPEGSANAPTTGAPSGDIQNLGQIIQRVQSGEMTQEEAAQLRQMFQGGGFGGPGGRLGAGLAGGGVLSGTVESVEDGKIIVNTPQGPLEAMIGPETLIQRTEISVISADELSEGVQVQVVGQPSETGVIDAASIFVVPEGAGGFGGFGGGGTGLGGGQ